ncbi:MAG TPA: EAL domain-containing protein [Solirubrobacteraceae bacterium]|nr:EAL domain-containing protein [Solirubrobacteraceae bacterium]
MEATGQEVVTAVPDSDATPTGEVDRAGVHVARQPILDRDACVVGYELLFRAPQAEGAQISDDLHATSAVIVDGLLDVGLFDLVGDSPAYVNVSREFLLDVRPLALPADRIVLELLDDQPVDDELIEVLRELHGQGFALALDHFRFTPHSELLLEHVQVVKVDVLEHTGSSLADVVARLREQRTALTLVAERVETREEFERCCELGFDAFQGFFFARPAHVGRKRMPSEGFGALRTMVELNATEDFDELGRIITRDAGLSMRLLRYANSAFVALPRRVGSIHESLSWLGASSVRRFALMVALSGARDVPSELLVTALVRARMCQLLCGDCASADSDSSFTVGLFSVADALANAPMQAVVEELPFREDVAAALLSGEGRLGELLHGVIAYQCGDFATAAALLRSRQSNIEQVYREAVKWADLSFAGLV